MNGHTVIIKYYHFRQDEPTCSTPPSWHEDGRKKSSRSRWGRWVGDTDTTRYLVSDRCTHRK